MGNLANETFGILSLQNANFEEVFSLSSLEYLPVFNDEQGQFPGQQHMTTNPSVKPVIMLNHRVPIAVRDRLKQEFDDLLRLMSLLLLQNLPHGRVK
ncbi:hypothetical protein PoB_004210200 [Plakobranchus ocellatus]|uniref:Uncharacterized protein n=1 Tax=Plakobranchus ocellatus TaxID=259542 RepID=A0AAV4B8T1_9GAST|nr:hypothetical protein PoB_004210200 [Plakobranchus ocellatus]